MNAPSMFPSVFMPRPLDSHKGTFGTLAIIGGSQGMSGAIVLASTAAMYTGCGKVWAGFHQKTLPMPIIAQHPEIMLACAHELLMREDISAWVTGCGLGLDEDAVIVLEKVLSKPINTPLLLDADALTLLSQHAQLSTLAQQHAHLILTPHPTEAARLLGISTADIQADRHTAVKAIAQKYQATVVLKGHHSLVYAFDNDTLYTNLSGNPGLATAGSGDVLSGVIGALCAQGIDNWQATCAGVWLHGAAADYLVSQIGGEIGLLSSELPHAVRYIRNRAIQPRQHQK